MAAIVVEKIPKNLSDFVVEGLRLAEFDTILWKEVWIR